MPGINGYGYEVVREKELKEIVYRSEHPVDFNVPPQSLPVYHTLEKQLKKDLDLPRGDEPNKLTDAIFDTIRRVRGICLWLVENDVDPHLYYQPGCRLSWEEVFHSPRLRTLHSNGHSIYYTIMKTELPNNLFFESTDGMDNLPVPFLYAPVDPYIERLWDGQ